MATSRPVLTGLTLSTYNIDLSGGPVSVTFTATGTDNGAQIDDAIIDFSANGGFNFLGGTQSLYRFPWVNGQDSVTVIVPTTTHSGVYTIADVVLFDTNGVQVTYTAAQLQALGIQTVITVTNGGGNTNPGGTTPGGGGTTSSPMTINVHDVSLPANTFVTGPSLITSVNNSSNHVIGGYAFWDAGGGLGHLALNGVSQADGQWVVVDSASLSNISYFGGNSASSETIYVEVYDATTQTWSAYSSLTATTTASTSSSLVFTGNSGDDTFHTGGGNRTFIGGGGHDTLVFQGSSSQYTYTEASNGSLTFTDSIAARDFIDITINIEFLQFTNGIVFIENSDNANIARLYSAAFDRAPDIAGLSFWENIYATNISSSTKSAGYYVSLAQTNLGSGTSIAGGFMQSSEFINRYGSLTDSNFVIQLYQNVLGRAPDQAGLNFWVNQLEGGGQTREIVLVGFAESPENVAKTSAEWLIAL